MKMKGLVTIAILLVWGLAAFDLAAADRAAQRPLIVMVVAPRDFTDKGYADPRTIFEERGARVLVASTSNGEAIGHDGLKVHVDRTLGDPRLDQFDAIVIVGGAGALTYLMDDEALRAILIGACKTGRIVGALCVAPAVLAHAGVLRNRQATCYPDQRVVAVLKRNGADYSERSLVTSGRVVTANGPEAGKDFASGVLDLIWKR